jgi:hypothetical protein
VENFPTGFFFSVVTLVPRQFGVIGGITYDRENFLCWGVYDDLRCVAKGWHGAPLQFNSCFVA